MTRLTAIGLAAVLIALCGFAIYSAVRTQQEVEATRDATMLLDGYGHADVAITEIKDGLDEARATGSVRTLTSLLPPVARLKTAIGGLSRQGGGYERDLARFVRDAELDATRTGNGLLRALQRGDSARANVYAERLDDDYSAVRARLSAAANRQRHITASRMDTLEMTQERLLLATPIAFVLGMALIGVFLVLYVRADRAAERSEKAALKRAAFVDSLTGLRNHRAFQEDLSREMERARRTGAPLSLVMLDLDGLKAINDARGHQAGDERIRAVAGALRAAARRADIAYRVGGDEFALIAAEAPA